MGIPRDYDDCVSDLGPLQEVSLIQCLVSSVCFSSAIAYSYFDDDAYCSSDAQTSQDELDRGSDDNCALHCLIGSDGFQHHTDPPKSRAIHIEDFNVYLVQPHLGGCVDVVEVFGRESGVGKLCIRRRLVRGDGRFSDWF